MISKHQAALLSVLLATGVLAGAFPLHAQQATVEATTAPITEADVVTEGENVLSPAEVDTLIGPVALFSDKLLTQVLMASTYPLDVVKAERWLKDNAELSDQDRADAASKQDWDPSVQQLAAGFPTVINRMAEQIDWTEQTGEAVLVQTDDVLDSIQRLRAQAKLNGYLDSNDAQAVETTEDGNISISSSNADVVYVPTYDPQVVYTTPAPATPYYVSDGNNWNDALATGAIFFGSAILINEIFDNDDWDDYWHGPGPIRWNDGDFYPRPGVEIGGNVNINRGGIDIDRNRLTNIDRNNIDIDRNNIGNRVDRGDLNIDRDRPDRDRPGSMDRDALDKARDRGFKPDAAQRDAAKAKIEGRKARGEGIASMPVPGKARESVQARPAAAKPQINRPAASRPQIDRPVAAKHGPVSKPAAAKRPTVQKSGGHGSAMKQTGGSRAHAASRRGHASRGGGHGMR